MSKIRDCTRNEAQVLTVYFLGNCSKLHCILLPVSQWHGVIFHLNTEGGYRLNFGFESGDVTSAVDMEYKKKIHVKCSAAIDIADTEEDETLDIIFKKNHKPKGKLADLP